MFRSIKAFVARGTLAAVVAVGPADQAPAPPPGPLTLEGAVAFARQHYPAIRASLADLAAAEANVDLARAAYWPSTKVRAGIDRATRNNVFGLSLPNAVTPSISGPVLDSESTSTFGSSLGVLLSWEPFDFGVRGARVRVAEALESRAGADQAVVEYEVSLAVADAYFSVVAQRQAVTAATATVERMQVFADTVAVLVANELRPGADGSRAQAELAQARTELIRGQQAADSALVTLAQALGLAGESLELRPGRLLGDPPPAVASEVLLEDHPRAAAQQAQVAIAEARRDAAAKAWRPTVLLQSAVYGRGSGANIDGTFAGGAGGLSPSVSNWAVGVSVNFDLLGFAAHDATRRIETQEAAREQANRDMVFQSIRGDVARADIAVEAARQVAANTPVQLDAARTLEGQATARYRAGLGTVVEVAEAQRLLRQAEVEDALARLGVWRALFGLAAATGEMNDLLHTSSN